LVRERHRYHQLEVVARQGGHLRVVAVRVRGLLLVLVQGVRRLGEVLEGPLLQAVAYKQCEAVLVEEVLAVCKQGEVLVVQPQVWKALVAVAYRLAQQAEKQWQVAVAYELVRRLNRGCLQVGAPQPDGFRHQTHVATVFLSWCHGIQVCHPVGEVVALAYTYCRRSLN